MKNKKLLTLLPYLGYFILIMYLFYPALTAGPDKYLFGWDVLDHGFARIVHFHEEIRSGRFPWWDPYLTSGHPFAASIEAPAVFYPLSWIFVLLSFAPALTWFYIIHLFILMSGTYLTARLWCSRLESWFAGVSLGLSGYFIPRIYAGTVGNLAAASWLPLVFWVFWKIQTSDSRRKRTGLVITGALLSSLQILAGDQRMALFTLICIVVSALFIFLYRKKIIHVLYIMTAFILSLLLSAIQLLPAMQFILASYRVTQTDYGYVWQRTSLSGEHMKELLYPFTVSYTPDMRNYPPFPEGPFYTGIITLVLAVTACIYLFIFFFRYKKTVNKQKILLPFTVFVSIAVLSIWLARAGDAVPDLFYLFWKYVPLSGLVRVPLRFVLLFAFSSTMLASLLLNVIHKKAVTLAAVIILLAELVPFSRKFLVLSGIPSNLNDKKAVSILTSDHSLVRVLQNFIYTERLGGGLDMNSPEIYHLYSTNGYLPIILENYYEFYHAAAGYDKYWLFGMNQLPPFGKLNPPALDFLNVKYIVARGDFNAEEMSDRYPVLYDNSSLWFKVVENPSSGPRFFMAPEAVWYKDRNQLLEAVRTGKEDISQTILFADKNKGGSRFVSECLESRTGNVKVVSYKPAEIILTTDTPCDSYLSSSEVMYPGWTVYVDGRKAQLAEANGAFRSLFVKTGRHNIVMKYEPRIFLYGGLITVGTVLCLFIIWRRKCLNSKHQ